MSRLHVASLAAGLMVGFAAAFTAAVPAQSLGPLIDRSGNIVTGVIDAHQWTSGATERLVQEMLTE